MEPTTFQLFFAILALAANIGTVAVVAARLLARRSAVAADVTAVATDVALPLAWLVALTCTLGSLYFSEVANYIPCTLCWYQRIAMYPLAVILLVAVVRKDRGVVWYALPVAAIGLAISTYHYLEEWFPSIDSGVCSSTIPCSFVWFRKFGFISLPYMALSGFAFIIALITLRPQEDAP
ncbi:MAG TPA: disulfide oxidoreductase [Acidimicrobiales bacterium]